MKIVPVLERIASFFGLPQVVYDPAAEVEREGRGVWPRLFIATWLMMAASLAALWSVTNQLWLVIEMTVILAVAYPVAFRLHYRTTSRLLVNWLAFSSALVLGIVQLRIIWPLYGGVWAAENVDAMAFLVICFMWITVFRAFSLRTVTDLVQTVLPCGSVILLVLLLRPVPLTLGCMALVVLSTLALLSFEYRIHSGQVFHPVATLSRTRGLRRTGALYSWPTLYALVLIVAMLVAYAAARAELSGGWGEVVRIALARRVLRWIQPHEMTSSMDNTLLLWRMTEWPQGTLPVFRVRTKVPGNYRMVVYHKYDGLRWERGRRRNTRAPISRGVFRIPLAGSGASQVRATPSEQTFTAVKGLIATLPSLFVPVSVEVNQRRLRYDADRILQLPRWVSPGASFTVLSYSPPVVPELRPGVDLAPEELALDRQLPPTLPARVRQLAREVASGGRTPYEKVRALEQHLMWGYQYTLQPPSSWPNDFVDHFLFVSKRGFCQHFASAMVVMCRCLGFPARMVGGFLPGEEDKDDPDLYTVREKDAHAWVEVYFTGAGWVSFDPTPPAPEERRPLAEAWQAISQGARAGATYTWRLARDYWPTAAALLLGLALLLAAWRWHHWHRLPSGFRHSRELARVVRAYLRWRQVLAGTGLPTATMGPRELCASLPPGLAPARQEALALTEKYLQIRFSGQTPTPAQAREVEALWQSLGRALRQAARNARRTPTA